MEKTYALFDDRWLAVIPPQLLIISLTTVQPTKDKQSALEVTCQEWRINLN